jgi:hypothetical protein
MAGPGGRTAGSLNKDRGRVLRAIRNYAGPEFDPAVKLIELAMRAEDEGELQLASQNYGRLMEYVYPKMRSVDVDVQGGIKLVAIDWTGVQDEDEDDDGEPED